MKHNRLSSFHSSRLMHALLELVSVTNQLCLKNLLG